MKSTGADGNPIINLEPNSTDVSIIKIVTNRKSHQNDGLNNEQSSYTANTAGRGDSGLFTKKSSKKSKKSSIKPKY